MDVQAEIAVLLAEADALRPLDDDDTRKIPLGAIVDKINALRAIEATQAREVSDEWRQENSHGKYIAAGESVLKPKRGRPAKTEG